MIKTSVILTLTMLLALNCFGQAGTTFAKADHYKSSKFDVAIFPANYYDLIPGQHFRPTKQEIDRAEIALSKQLKALNKQLVNQSSTPIIHKNLRKYKRQYFGYIDRKGDKILFINCFWAKDKNLTDGWLTDRIMVFDGGSYYWNVKFNLDKGVLFDLIVNGYA